MTRFATWNVNSLNARLGRIEQWIADIRPDILCMQETKLADEAFPAMAFEALGYESAHHGEGRWNGVGILSRVGLDRGHDGVRRRARAGLGGAGDDGALRRRRRHQRLRAQRSLARPRAVPVQAAAGSSVWPTSPSGVRKQHDAVILAGDFNIAPADIDVYSPAAFDGATHVSPPERAVVQRFVDDGWHDVAARLATRTIDRVFSWWDYRRGDFHEGRGMRIDLVLATAPVAERVDVVRHRPQRPQGPAAQRPRPRHRGFRVKQPALFGRCDDVGVR